MARDPKEARALKQRLLVIIGRQLILHVHMISVLCYTAGVLIVLLLPLLAKSTHISENALMPGSANPAYDIRDAVQAQVYAKEVKALMSHEHDHQRAVSKWLVQRLSAIGADCSLHPFYPPSIAPASFPVSYQHFKWSSSNKSNNDHLNHQKGLAVNVVGIIRAPQAEGTEAIVLVTPFDVELFGEEDAVSLGIGLALFACLTKALWIARDIIWLVADAKYGAYPAVAEWLREYHEPIVNHFSRNAEIKADLLKELYGESFMDKTYDLSLSDFKRAGTIATGLVFELRRLNPGELSDTLTLRAEASNGHMPNLDLINIINSIAVWRESLHLQLDIIPSLKGSMWFSYLGVILERISNLVRLINSNWDFTSAAAAYPKNLEIFLSSIVFQVIGLPTGAHGAFRDYQIDAVSLQFPYTGKMTDYYLAKFGRLLEGVLRSVNNLLEKWHQSLFLYMLSAPHKFISVSLYIIPFALLVIGLPLTAVALFFPANEEKAMTEVSKDSSAPNTENVLAKSKDSDELSCRGNTAANESSKWLEALFITTMVEIWAIFIALVLSLISQTNFVAELNFLMWVAVATLSLTVAFVVYLYFSSGSRKQPQLWVAIKALTLGLASIGLAVTATLNFPVALVGALILVPMCLGVFPLHHSWKKANRPAKRIQVVITVAIGTLMTVVGSLPGLIGLVSIFFSHLWRPSPANIWYLMVGLLNWQSALFPYLLVIHLPCSVLCMCILLSTDHT